jgi:undecaprenyl-diphosphatase
MGRFSMHEGSRDNRKKRDVGRVNRPSRILFVPLLSFIILTILVAAGATQRLDDGIGISVLGIRSPPGNVFWGGITLLGSYWVVAIATAIFALVLYRFRSWSDSVAYPALVGLGAACAELVKFLVARPRPDFLLNLSGEGYGYPSSHTMAAVCCYLGFAWFVSKGKMSKSNKTALHAAGWAIVGMVGFSRVYMGWHYATDVLGSIMMGLSLVMLFGFIHERLQELSRPPSSGRRPLQRE